MSHLPFLPPTAGTAGSGGGAEGAALSLSLSLSVCVSVAVGVAVGVAVAGRQGPQLVVRHDAGQALEGVLPHLDGGRMGVGWGSDGGRMGVGQRVRYGRRSSIGLDKE